MKNKIKVVFLFGALGGGGAERQFGILVDKLDREIFDPVIISIGYEYLDYSHHLKKFPDIHSFDEFSKKEEFSKFHLYRKLRDRCRIHFIKRRKFLETQWAVYRCLQVEKPSIIFFVVPIAALYGGIASWIFNDAKIICGIRGNDILFGHTKSLINIYHFFSQLYVDLFVANSRGLMENAKNSGFLASKISYIYNGIPAFYDDIKFNEDGPIRIGYIARLEKVKNHTLFLRVIKSLPDEFEFTVHLYGSGSLENELRNMALQLKIDDRIFFEGWNSDVSGILPKMDIVCLTSDYEGFNNSISEAQMHGIPVVTTNCTGCAEIVEDGVTGYVVPRGDAEVFSYKLGLLVEDKELRRRYSLAAFQKSRRDFTIAKMCNKYQEVFQELVKD